MLKRFLVIFDVGYFLCLPGGLQFRTPARIDISRLNLDEVILELRKTGVGNYRIEVTDNSNRKISDSSAVRTDLVDEVKHRLDKIEELLKQSCTSKEVLQLLTGKIGEKSEERTFTNKYEKSSEPEFIPDVNLSKVIVGKALPIVNKESTVRNVYEISKSLREVEI